jgi:hypothetical protein
MRMSGQLHPRGKRLAVSLCMSVGGPRDSLNMTLSLDFSRMAIYCSFNIFTISCVSFVRHLLYMSLQYILALI